MSKITGVEADKIIIMLNKHSQAVKQKYDALPKSTRDKTSFSNILQRYFSNKAIIEVTSDTVGLLSEDNLYKYRNTKSKIYPFQIFHYFIGYKENRIPRDELKATISRLRLQTVKENIDSQSCMIILNSLLDGIQDKETKKEYMCRILQNDIIMDMYKKVKITEPAKSYKGVSTGEFRKAPKEMNSLCTEVYIGLITKQEFVQKASNLVW